METRIIVLIVIVVFIILLSISFMRWKKSARRVMDDGEVIETAMGKIGRNMPPMFPTFQYPANFPILNDAGFLCLTLPLRRNLNIKI